MANSDFWRDLAREFLQLPDPHMMAEARWTLEGIDGPIRWGLLSVGPFLEVRFINLGSRAGRALDVPPFPPERDLWDVCLNAILKEKSIEKTESGKTKEFTADGFRSVRSGRIPKIVQESAIFCGILEGRALQAEGRAATPIQSMPTSATSDSEADRQAPDAERDQNDSSKQETPGGTTVAPESVGMQAKPADSAELAEARQRVVLPKLAELGMSRSQWASKAGVDPWVVYNYLEGKSKPRPQNRRAMAEAIGLMIQQLPL